MGVERHALEAARIAGVIRPSVRDDDAVTWAWLTRAKAWRARVVELAAAEVKDRHVAMHERLLDLSERTATALEADVDRVLAGGKEALRVAQALEKLVKVYSHLADRPTTRVEVDLSDASLEALRKAMAALEES
jgi:hypothetical protein